MGNEIESVLRGVGAVLDGLRGCSPACPEVSFVGKILPQPLDRDNGLREYSFRQ